MRAIGTLLEAREVRVFCEHGFEIAEASPVRVEASWPGSVCNEVEATREDGAKMSAEHEGSSYGAVRVVSLVLKVVAWLTLLGGMAVALRAMQMFDGFVVAATTAGMSVVSFAVTLALGQLVQIAADVGQATARTAASSANAAASMNLLYTHVTAVAKATAATAGAPAAGK
ncbi:MAG: hypothetical protein ACHREM_01755 [Polyangiales bacterium]